MKRLIPIALLALALATPAFADLPPMAQDKHINDELRAGFAGDTLRKTCPTISAASPPRRTTACRVTTQTA